MGKLKFIKALFFSLLFILPLVSFSQGSPSKEELKKTSEHIEKLIKRDSLNNLIIQELKSQLGGSAKKDSSLYTRTLDKSPAPTALEKLERKLKKRNSGPEQLSLLAYIIISFGAGFIALFTPCVFPMIPMTVTFFTGGKQKRSEGVKKAIIYGLSIILLYFIIGLLFGPALANLLSTHWLPNVIFSAVFVVFALSFLGMFEITLPASIVNKADEQADKGGYYGVFFMAVTLVLVSFSCTAPIVGNILVMAWAEGQILRPALGMLAYATAFAVPFSLFALFPSWLSKLPKSGGWLNVIKVILGYIELALALKFLSIADQVYHWGILDREIYIAIWIVLSALLGYYLLGKYQLPHDSPVEKISVPRLLLAIFAFSFTMYLVPGLFGAPLKLLSGYLPPMSTHDFDLPGIVREYTNSHEAYICDEPKYASSNKKLPHGLNGYYTYEQAIECAKKKNMPLMLDFTGHGCVSCREMEANVWADAEVLKLLSNDFIIASLYVDDRTKLDSSDVFVSILDGKKKTTLGQKNTELQVMRFKNNAQPYYVLIDPFTEELLAEPTAYDPSVTNFLDFLHEAIKNFRADHPKE